MGKHMSLDSVKFFGLAFIWIAPILALILVPWRVMSERAWKRTGKRRPGPRWAFGLGWFLTASGPCLLMVALERTDGLDYPDGGNAAVWAMSGLLSLGVGIVLLMGASTSQAE
jgi:hypothetical protein